MQATSIKSGQPGSSKSTPLRNIGQSPKTEVSIWVRLGLPIALAVLAGGLNLSAVRHQLTPTPTYIWATDLPVGTVLSAEHLKVAEVAGTIDRNCFVTPADLIQSGDGGTALSLKDSLAKNPRILSKAVVSGEPLTKSSLSGRATAEPGTEVVSIPRSLISGGGVALQPGQEVHFVAQKRHGSADSQPKYIGPFRVALEERNSSRSEPADYRGTIALMYPLGPDGKRDESANILHEAALKDNQYTLVIIERATARRRSDNTAKSKGKSSAPVEARSLATNEEQ